MEKNSESSNFEYWDEHSPERKIELVGGRLIVGNSLAGSRLLLDHILRGWGLDAATALGSVDQWVAAICAAYGIPAPREINNDVLGDLQAKVSCIDYVAQDFTQGEEGEDGGHWRVRNHLLCSLHEVAEALGGQTLGRDFVMRLGADGFTPDIQFFKNRQLNKLYEYYLQGPAELVVEVVRPTHRVYDARIKREHYARGGVPNYLIVDPEAHEFKLLGLVKGDYVCLPAGADGLYRPVGVPGLAIAPQHLWAEGQGYSLRGKDNPFIVEEVQPHQKRQGGFDDGLGWGELQFAPKLDLQPVDLSFEEYICWSPESKFEFWDGKIQICGDEGVRNVVGMLLMTLGLTEVCRFASPTEWIACVQRRRQFEAREQELRVEWRDKALRAAEALRSKYNLKRIAITGDLLSPDRLSYWSRLTLALWDVPTNDMLRVYEDLSRDGIEVVESSWHYFQEGLAEGRVILEEI